MDSTTRAQRSRATFLALLVCGTDATTLMAVRPDIAVLGRVAHPRRWLTAVGPDQAAATLAGAALWLVACWIALCLLAWLAGTAPGGLGRLAQRTAHVITPRALRRLVAASLGLGVVLTPAVASAGASTLATGGSPAGVARGHLHGTALPTPRWPSDDPVHAPQWPGPLARVVGRHPDQPKVHTDPIASRPAPAAAGDVVVAPGDSLWRIAAERLPGRPTPPRIARAWPRWYAANRAQIGTDPNYLIPGQVLHAPPAAKGAQP